MGLPWPPADTRQRVPIGAGLSRVEYTEGQGKPKSSQSTVCGVVGW